jgi:drug/metabolite transporter (DMT)-like permease
MALAFSLLAALVYGAADFFGGIASRKTAPAFVVFASQGFGFLILGAGLAIVPGTFHWADVPFGIAAGVAAAAGIAFLYAALARGRMGIVSPITAVVGAAIPVLVGLAMGERPGTLAMAGVAAALLAVVLVSADAGTGRLQLRDPAVLLALASGAGIGALYVFLSKSSPDAGLWILVPTRITSMIVLGLYTLASRERPVLTAAGLAVIALAGALDMAANVLYVLATREGMLALVAVVTSLYPASTVFLARLFLDERLSRVQWLGVAFAAAGVVLIARGK